MIDKVLKYLYLVVLSVIIFPLFLPFVRFNSNKISALAANNRKKEDVDFTVFVDCIDENSNGTYTAYFSYTNYEKNTVKVSSQSIRPDDYSPKLPQNLQSGTHEKVFSVISNNKSPVSWNVSIGSVTKTATASINYPQCSVKEKEKVEKKITICHAAGLAGTTKYVTLTLAESAVFGSGGHFYENGTPRAGHEDDYFGPCILTTPSPTPTPKSTISISPTTTPTATDITPTATMTITPSPTNEITQTASPTPTETIPPTIIETVIPTISITITSTPSGTPIITQTTSPSPTEVITPTTTETISPSISVSPSATETIAPSITNTIEPTPSITPTIEIEPVPIEEIPTRIDAIRVSRGTEKTFSFNEEVSSTKSTCSESAISFNFPQVSGESGVAYAAYSVDGGKNWYQIKSNDITKIDDYIYKINSQTTSLESKLYHVQLKVQTNDGNIYKSSIIKHNHNCNGKSYITSYFVQNGFDVGIQDSSNSIHINGSLPTLLYMETVGAIENITVRNPETERSLNLEYNPNLSLWKGDISSILSDNANLEISTSINDTAKILPTIFIQEADETPEIRTLDFQIFYKIDNAWEELDYKKLLETDEEFTTGVFNLGAGTYFIRVLHENGLNQVTDQFTLTDRSIVSILGLKKVSILSPFIRLKVSIKGDNSIESSIFSNIEEAEISNELISIIKLQEPNSNNRYNVYGYWNRWNPRYSENLPIYSEIANNSDVSVTLISDINNIEELTRTLSFNSSNINSLTIDSNYFENKTTYIDREIIVYDSQNNLYYRVFGIQNLINVLELVE